jgi:hypothetical protein
VTVDGTGRWRQLGGSPGATSAGGHCDSTSRHPVSNYSGSITLTAVNESQTSSSPTFSVIVGGNASGSVGSGTDNIGANSSVSASGAQGTVSTGGTAGGSSAEFEYSNPATQKSYLVKSLMPEESTVIVSGNVDGNAYNYGSGMH